MDGIKYSVVSPGHFSPVDRIWVKNYNSAQALCLLSSYFIPYSSILFGAIMILSTLETVPGKTIVSHYGVVTGSTVRSKHAGRDFMAGLKNLFGGELKGYTELLNESRNEAIKRMVSLCRDC